MYQTIMVERQLSKASNLPAITYGYKRWIMTEKMRLWIRASIAKCLGSALETFTEFKVVYLHHKELEDLRKTKD